MTTLETSAPNTSTAVTTGALGGLAGGVVFGMLMAMMDMMPMVAMLVGSDSAGVGWLVHLAISAFLGAGFGVLAQGRVPSLATGIGQGAAYGLLWWVLGALVLMPLRLNMDLFMMNSTTMKSLMGHLIFGMVLGAVVAVRAKR